MEEGEKERKVLYLMHDPQGIDASWLHMDNLRIKHKRYKYVVYSTITQEYVPCGASSIFYTFHSPSDPSKIDLLF